MLLVPHFQSVNLVLPNPIPIGSSFVGFSLMRILILCVALTSFVTITALITQLHHLAVKLRMTYLLTFSLSPLVSFPIGLLLNVRLEVWTISYYLGLLGTLMLLSLIFRATTAAGMTILLIQVSAWIGRAGGNNEPHWLNWPMASTHNLYSILLSFLIGILGVIYFPISLRRGNFYL